MFHGPERVIQLVLAISVFLLVFAFWQGALLAWHGRRTARMRRVQARLGLLRDGDDANNVRMLRLWHNGREAYTSVAASRRLSSFMEMFDQICREAGWKISPPALLWGLFGGALLLFMATFALTGRVAAALAVTIAAFFIFQSYLHYHIGRRTALFERQFLDALHVAATSLRAGHPTSGAFRFISMEVRPPVGELFTEMCQQQELGVSLEQVVRNAAVKSGNPDMKLFATSVIVQLRSGGNLADMMERLARVIRERMNINRRVRVLTAQAKLSKRVLIALPIVFFCVLTLVNPSYMEPLHSTTEGKALLALAGIFLLGGVWLMNRLMVVDF